MNYSRAHFRGNEILNEVLRTSSAECMAELCGVIDLNGKSLVELMKHEKNSQCTWKGGGGEDRGEMIKELPAVLAPVLPSRFSLTSGFC